MSSYTIPSVIESTGRGERVSDIYSRLLSDRIVFVGTPIDDGVANVVIAQLLHLSAAAPERDIELYVNSPGGALTSVLAIHDTMRHVAPDIATLCVGQAAGAAALLVACGTAGKRSILHHARVMLHQPASEVRRGSMSELAVEAAEVARVRRDVEDVLAAHTGHSSDTIRADIEHGLILTAAEAVDYGVADMIAGGSASSGEQFDPSRALRPDS